MCTGRNLIDGLYIGEMVRSIRERIYEQLNKYEVQEKPQFSTNTLRRSLGVKNKS